MQTKKFCYILMMIIILIISSYSAMALNSIKTSCGDYNSETGKIEVSNVNFTTLINTGSGTHSHNYYRSYVDVVTLLYYIDRAFFFFDTSSLPDNCLILSANMFFYIGYKEGSVIYNYIQRAECGNFLNNNDFNKTKYTVNVSKFIPVGYKSFNVSFTSNLTNAINKTGVSCFVIRSSEDYSGIYSAEHFWEGTNFSTIRLYVSYYNSASILSNPLPPDNSINIKTNPKLSIDTNEMNNYSMDIYFRTNASGVWATIGSNLTVKNGTYTQQTTGMGIYSHKYYWSVNSTNGVLWKNETYSFTTKGYLPVTVTSPYPSNNSLDVTGEISALHVLIRSGNGLPFNYSISLSNGDTYGYSNDDNGTRYLNLSFPLNYSTIYRWWVNVTDGISTTSYYYRFRVETAPPTTIKFDMNQFGLVILMIMSFFFLVVGLSAKDNKLSGFLLILDGVLMIDFLIAIVVTFGTVWLLISPGMVLFGILILYYGILIIRPGKK